MSDPLTIRFSLWPDPAAERAGFHARSDYVERVWACLLGPTALACLRAAVLLAETAGGEATVTMEDFCRSLGVRHHTGRSAAVWHALALLADFGLAAERPGGYAVRAWVRPLTRRLLLSAPSEVRELHRLYLAERAPSAAGSETSAPPPRRDVAAVRAGATPSAGGAGGRPGTVTDGHDPTPRGSVLSSALVYVRRGWVVLPCHSVQDGACSCGEDDCSSPGKHPRVRHGLHDATTRYEVVRRWWARWPDANVGLRTGATGGGLVVVDIDPEHGGEDSLGHLVAEHGELPAGPEVATGSGGRHLYFAHPGGKVPNSAGSRLGAGLDVRGDGGYVVAPPSRHVSGGTYRWTRLGPLPYLPEWLLHLLVAPRDPAPVTTAPTSLPRDATAWARAALEAELRAVRGAPVGQRNHQLNRSAFALGQIVAGGHLAAGVVAALLEEAGLAAGLAAREVRATVASGMQAGAELPRHPVARPGQVTR